MTPHFDFSEVPYPSACAAENCLKASTCLRRIAMQYAPVNRIFLPTMNPNRIIAGKGKCDCYCSNEKTLCTWLYARQMHSPCEWHIRYRMISYFGRKNYYLKRRGALKITPAEQIYVINVAKELGVVLNDYFDGYMKNITGTLSRSYHVFGRNLRFYREHCYIPLEPWWFP